MQKDMAKYKVPRQLDAPAKYQIKLHQACLILHITHYTEATISTCCLEFSFMNINRKKMIPPFNGWLTDTKQRFKVKFFYRT